MGTAWMATRLNQLVTLLVPVILLATTACQEKADATIVIHRVTTSKVHLRAQVVSVSSCHLQLTNVSAEELSLFRIRQPASVKLIVQYPDGLKFKPYFGRTYASTSEYELIQPGERIEGNMELEKFVDVSKSKEGRYVCWFRYNDSYPTKALYPNRTPIGVADSDPFYVVINAGHCVFEAI